MISGAFSHLQVIHGCYYGIAAVMGLILDEPKEEAFVFSTACTHSLFAGDV